MKRLLEFYNKYRRTLLATFGIFMITGALAALYWSNSSGGVSSENAKASKSIERMKAKGLLGNSKSSSSKKSSPKSLMSSYMEKKGEQNRILLIVLIVGGVIALVMSFLSKKSDKTISAK